MDLTERDSIPRGTEKSRKQDEQTRQNNSRKHNKTNGSRHTSYTRIQFYKRKTQSLAVSNDKVAQMQNKIPKSHTVIMCSDINAAIGNSMTIDDTNSDFTLLGIHRKFRNDHGDMIRNLVQLHNLKFTTTFFENKGKFNTWIHPAAKK